MRLTKINVVDELPSLDGASGTAIDAEVGMNDITLSSSTVAKAQAVRGTTYRDIAIHLDGSPEDESRLAHAEALAVDFSARWNDLFIATCPRDDEHGRWRPLIESVMFDGGRGLLLLPPKLTSCSPIRTVLVGWTDTRQSARAVAEALPLIAQATQVHIVTVREEAHGRMGGAEILADISAHLARHGVEATATVLSTETSPTEALLAEARRISADLIVVGAYGHSRFREWVLGGVTADLLDLSPVPLFLAH